MSNYTDRAARLKRRAHEVANLPILQRAAEGQRIALDSVELLHDLASEIDKLKGADDAENHQ